MRLRVHRRFQREDALFAGWILALELLLVAGPRIAAGASRAPLDWIAPFTLFLGAVLASRLFG